MLRLSKPKLIDVIFIGIGVIVGIILSLQILANPIRSGSSAADQLETGREVLAAFSVEQENLKKKLEIIDQKIEEADKILARRSDPGTVRELNRLKSLTGYDALEGEGIRIILNDSAGVSRSDFSTLKENFVQATDIRDLVNALFVREATAVVINGKRVLPISAIQSVFDTILIGNFTVTPPFVVEAVGNIDSLKEAVKSLQKRRIQIFVDTNVGVKIVPAGENVRSLKFISEP